MKIYMCTENMALNIISYQLTSFPDPNVEEWRGVTVFGERSTDGSLHPLTMSLLTKAREMADADGDKAQLLLIGDGLVETARNYFADGADRVYVYDDPDLAAAETQRYIEIMAHFIDNYKPAAILFPPTALSNHLADSIIRYAETIGNETESQRFRETIPSGKASNPDHRGELLICEIPDRQ